MKSRQTSSKPSSKAPSPLKLRDAAIEAAHAAGHVLTGYFGKKIRVGEKKGAGLVTNADIEAEEAVLRVLGKKFPGFGFLMEESGAKAGSESRGRWIVDPLDGTTNFVHRFPMFCVSIAAEWEGQIVAGVIYHPIFKETYVAVRGQGASIDGKPLRVSGTREIRDSLLTTGFAYQRAGDLHREMAPFERLTGSARAVRRPGSAALDLAYTARGVFDGFWERHLSPWDVAAGALLVEEAGGKVTDFQGNPFDVSGAEVLASNGKIHPALLHAMTAQKGRDTWPGPV